MAKIVIFDSDILIDYFMAIEEAKEFIYSFEKEERFVTSISIMEIYRGARNKGELAAFKKFFVESFGDILHVDEEASRLSLKLVESYTLSHGLILPDAIIAALAILQDANLFTGNVRHFGFIHGLKVSLPDYRRSER